MPTPVSTRLRSATARAQLFPQRLFAGSLCLLLAACGGGGSSGTDSGATSPVTVSLSSSASTSTVGQTVTIEWNAANLSSDAGCSASGAWSGSLAASGSATVALTSQGTQTYTITCSGVSSTASVLVNAVPNTVPMVVDSGPSGSGVINAAFVDVTICRPGTTVCQTIDHILVDTGSYGLRLISSLNGTLDLPAVTTPDGLPAGECAQFVSGYSWGSVKRADIKLGSESVAGIPIQVIGDPAAAFATPPASCTGTGADLGSVAALGANGVLGLGMLKEDCPQCVTSAISAAYYGCNGSTCVPSVMPLTSQVSNPAASFAVDNQGVVLVFPSVPSGGAQTLTGSLVFGIGTQENNTITTQTVYRANSSGYFTTSYKGTVYTSSFIDSGSNGLFFDDNSIPDCASRSGFYCPTSTLTLSASNAAYDSSTSGTVSFTIENFDQLSSSINVASVGGSYGNQFASGSFDYGLPFFYGRKVFVAYNNALTSQGSGPYWAY